MEKINMKAQSKAYYKAMTEVHKPRLQPPAHLSEAHRLVWCRTVDNLPHDWFSLEQEPTLLAYCCHVVRFAQIEAALATLDPVADLDQFDRLAKLAGNESAKLASHARAMRLTQQTRLKAETAFSRGGAAAATWDADGLRGDGLLA